jgi:hypothetical protein
VGIPRRVRVKIKRELIGLTKKKAKQFFFDWFKWIVVKINKKTTI